MEASSMAGRGRCGPEEAVDPSTTTQLGAVTALSGPRSIETSIFTSKSHFSYFPSPGNRAQQGDSGGPARDLPRPGSRPEACRRHPWGAQRVPRPRMSPRPRLHQSVKSAKYGLFRISRRRTTARTARTQRLPSRGSRGQGVGGQPADTSWLETRASNRLRPSPGYEVVVCDAEA